MTVHDGRGVLARRLKPVERNDDGRECFYRDGDARLGVGVRDRGSTTMRETLNPIMTLGEVARFLRVHPSSIYRLLRVEGIPAFRVGSDWRFRRDSVAEWVRSKTVTVGATR